MHRASALLLVLPVCCAPARELGLIAEDEAKSALLVRTGERQNAAISAHDLAVPERLGVEWREDLRVFALLYSVTLADLGLNPGEVPVLEEGRRIPPFLRGVELEAAAELGWAQRSEEELRAQIDHLRIPAFPPGECEQRGGCLRDPLLGVTCEMPCRLPDAPREPAAVEAPALPELTPCPLGWLETSTGAIDLSVCQPTPEQQCASGSHHFVGEEGCRSIGSDCPVGLWPASIPAGRPVRYVLQGSAPGGDGSLDRPFGLASAAIAAAPSNAVIVLSKGTFVERLQLPSGMVLLGACVAETVVRSDIGPIIEVLGPSATVENLSMLPRDRAVLVRPGAGLRLAGTEVLSGAGDAITVEAGGFLDASDLVVWGHNVGLRSLGTSSVSRASFITPGAGGIYLDGGALRATDLRVRGGGVRGIRGFGIEVVNGGELDLLRASFVDNDMNDIGVFGEGSLARLSDIRIESTVPSNVTRQGIDLFRGGSAIGERIQVFGKPDSALWVNAEGSGRFEDVVIGNSGRGGGITVRGGGEAALTRVYVTASRDIGATAISSRLALADTTIEGTRGQAGILSDASNLTLARVQIESSREAGMVLSGDNEGATSAEGSDLRISTSGINGLRIGSNTRASLTRILIEDSENTGLAFGSELDSVFEDLVVRSSGRRGLNVTRGLPLFRRIQVRESGLVALDVQNAVCDLEDAWFENEHPISEAVGVRGHPSGVTPGVQVKLQGFVLSIPGGTGAAFGQNAELTLQDGLIADSAIGIDAQGGTLELLHLGENVVFRGVDRHIEPPTGH